MNEYKEEKWINVDEVASYFGVKPATIREWIRKNSGIPAQKIGKSWKFKYSEIEEWAKKQRCAK